MNILDMIGRGLAAEAYEPGDSRMCQVRRIDARHRLEEWIELDLYALPMGASLQDEADKVHAAAHAHWRELRRLPTGDVLQY